MFAVDGSIAFLFLCGVRFNVPFAPRNFSRSAR